MRLLLSTLLLLLAMPAFAQKAPTARNPADAQKKLEALRTEIKALTREQQALEDKRNAASRDLREIDGKVAGSAGALRRIDAGIAEREARLAQLHVEQQANEQRMKEQREALAQLLRSSYALGRGGNLKLLLSQDSPDELARMQAYHRYFEADRQRRIERVRSDMAAQAALATQVEAERTALASEREQQGRALATLAEQRRKRGQWVKGLDSRFHDREARIQALARDEQALKSLLEKLRAAIVRAPAVAPIRPRKPDGGKPMVARTLTGWPLAGSLLAGYGNALPDGRRSEGLLIAANAGDSVRAVAAGRVVFADWLKGYGLLLILDHGEGWMSLYAYNDALLKNVGDSVKAGDALAAVGNSGGQGRAALYFEMRRNGQPQKPDDWLKP